MVLEEFVIESPPPDFPWDYACAILNWESWEGWYVELFPPRLNGMSWRATVGYIEDKESGGGPAKDAHKETAFEAIYWAFIFMLYDDRSRLTVNLKTCEMGGAGAQHNLSFPPEGNKSIQKLADALTKAINDNRY